MSANAEFELPPWMHRQRVVGDIVIHPEHGTGPLVQSWDAFLQVEFPSGLVTLRGADSFTLVPLQTPGTWRWLSRHEADAWVAAAAANRAAALVRLRRALEENYLETDARRSEYVGMGVSEAEYQKEKRSLLTRWWHSLSPESVGKQPPLPDDEQFEAIGATESNVQVVARAGSGKTSVLTDRAALLLRHCGVKPGEMLLVTFNKRAAQEMEARLLAKLPDGNAPFVMTFHALAWAIAGGEAELLRNERSLGEEALDREFQALIDERLQEATFFSRVRALMLAHFRADWNRIIEGGYDLSRDEMLKLRRSLVSETLRGEFVKSFGEKRIANFLFEHGVPYRYEQTHEWNGRAYRPDFTLPRGEDGRGLVIEYFGLKGDVAYDEQAEEKRKFWRARGEKWRFIELSPIDIAGEQDSFETRLARRLEACGTRCAKLSEDEIWEAARQRAVDKFSRCCSQFVTRCRQSWIEPENLTDMVAAHQSMCEIEERFLELVVQIYGEYLARLEQTGRDDFCGLLQRAIQRIEAGRATFRRGEQEGNLRALRFVLVDEYQDFTELFFRLVKAIRQQSPHASLFVVGDDWQSINGFAGADLKFFKRFPQYFAPSRRLRIATNYRSAHPIVATGNALMASDGGPPARPSPGAAAGAKAAYPVSLVHWSTVPATTAEWVGESGDRRMIALLRIASKWLAIGRRVCLLNHRSTIYTAKDGQVSLDEFLRTFRVSVPRPWRELVTASTTHKFKGNQADVVIILDAVDRSYPLIHPDWVFNRLLGESPESIEEENRRLFYVALTRAIVALYLMTERDHESPYVADIGRGARLRAVKWADYPPPQTDVVGYAVRVSDAYEVKDVLKAEGFRYLGGKQTWEKWFPAKPYADNVLESASWAVGILRVPGSAATVKICDAVDQTLAEFQVISGRLEKLELEQSMGRNAVGR